MDRVYTFGRLLKLILRLTKIKQSRLAIELGVVDASVSNWINKGIEPCYALYNKDSDKKKSSQGSIKDYEWLAVDGISKVIVTKYVPNKQFIEEIKENLLSDLSSWKEANASTHFYNIIKELGSINELLRLAHYVSFTADDIFDVACVQVTYFKDNSDIEAKEWEKEPVEDVSYPDQMEKFERTSFTDFNSRINFLKNQRHITKNNTDSSKICDKFEKFAVTKLWQYRKEDRLLELSKVNLVESSEKNAHGSIDIIIDEDPKNVSSYSYYFVYSFIHNILQSGKILLSNTDDWKEKFCSNGFEIELHSKILDDSEYDKIPIQVDNVNDILVVNTKRIMSNYYSGPRCIERLLVFAKGIGIIYSNSKYKNNTFDEYILVDYKTNNGHNLWMPANGIGNYWTYKILSDKAPNEINIKT